MYCAQFIFKAGLRDDDYFSLHKEISDFCSTIEDFVGVERWVSLDGENRNSAYYFETLEGLRQLSEHSTHRLAKSQYRRWYDGYKIVISEIIKTYGDNNIQVLAS